MSNFLLVLFTWFVLVQLINIAAKRRWSFWVCYHLTLFIVAMKILEVLQ